MIPVGDNEIRVRSRAWAVPPEVDVPCPVRPVKRVNAPGTAYVETREERNRRRNSCNASGERYEPEERDVAGCFVVRMLPQPFAVGSILLPDTKGIKGELTPDAGYIVAVAPDVPLPVGRVALVDHTIGKRVVNARFGPWRSKGPTVRVFGSGATSGTGGTATTIPYDRSCVALLPTFRLKPIDGFDNQVIQPQERFGMGYAVAVSMDAWGTILLPFPDSDAVHHELVLPQGTHVVFVSRVVIPVCVGPKGMPLVEAVHPDAKLQAIGRRVIVQTDNIAEKSVGGVLLQKRDQRKDSTGVVVSVGHLCEYESEPGVKLKPGDRVMYQANTATPITGEAVDANLRIMTEDSIQLVLP